jgi:hypothetical protein
MGDRLIQEGQFRRPSTGRFTSPDPIEDDAANPYRAMGNSPTNATDPSGLDEARVIAEQMLGMQLPDELSDSEAEGITNRVKGAGIAYSTRKVTVGTVKKSQAATPWLLSVNDHQEVTH